MNLEKKLKCFSVGSLILGVVETVNFFYYGTEFHAFFMIGSYVGSKIFYDIYKDEKR